MEIKFFKAIFNVKIYKNGKQKTIINIGKNIKNWIIKNYKNKNYIIIFKKVIKNKANKKK